MVEKKGEKIMEKENSLFNMEVEIKKDFEHLCRYICEEMMEFISNIRSKKLLEKENREFKEDLESIKKIKILYETMHKLEYNSTLKDLLSKREMDQLESIADKLWKKYNNMEKNKGTIEKYIENNQERIVFVNNLLKRRIKKLYELIIEIDETVLEKFQKYNIQYTNIIDEKNICILGYIYLRHKDTEKGQNKVKCILEKFFHKDEKDEKFIEKLIEAGRELENTIQISPLISKLTYESFNVNNLEINFYIEKIFGKE